MLRIWDYKKTYGSLPVLEIQNLALSDGVYWLKGENGSGKTTLLKSIAGLLPIEGNIEVDGTSLRKERRLYTQKVSFAEAEPVYPGFLTGHELLEFYLATKGGSEKKSEQIAEALSIADYLPNKVATYSSGMTKKLSLLLCFTGNPKLLLLDEPFVTLDAAAVNVLQDLILESIKETSFLISSHQELALPFRFETLHIHRQSIEHDVYAKGSI